MEILTFDYNIQLVPARITFNQLDDIQKEAERLSEALSNVGVTEESAQENKKLVASVRKKVNELDTIRKNLKKALLKPYEPIESQIKDILTIVGNGEKLVREQLNTLDEDRRHEVVKKIDALFYKRIEKYPSLTSIEINPNHFIKREHTNKTTSFDKVELEMVEWFERLNNEIKSIQTLQNSNEILAEYIASDFRLDVAMLTVNQRKQREAELSAMNRQQESNQDVFKLTLFSKKDYQAVKGFLIENDIKFKGEV